MSGTKQDRPGDVAAAAARHMWDGDAASQQLGMEIVSIDEGTATLEMTVRADMVNGHGACHGGLIFALADSAFAFACNSRGDVEVAAGASIDYVAAAMLDDRLTATATERHHGRRGGVYDVEVRRDDGRLIAIFRGRSAALGRRIPDGKNDTE